MLWCKLPVGLAPSMLLREQYGLDLLRENSVRDCDFRVQHFLPRGRLKSQHLPSYYCCVDTDIHTFVIRSMKAYLLLSLCMFLPQLSIFRKVVHGRHSQSTWIKWW